MKEANADPTLTWGSVAEKKLKGKVISEVRYMTAEEVEHIGWDSKGLIMVLTDPDGSNELLVWPSRDDEGNGPGAIFTSADDLPIVPVIPYWK